MRTPILFAAALALVLAGCGKKEDTAATNAGADTSLASQNAATPAGGAGDTAKAMSQAERGGTTLPPGTPENAPAARRGEHKSREKQPSRRESNDLASSLVWTR